MILVIAGNYQQYLDYCSSLGINPKATALIRYVYGVYSLLGYHQQPEIVYYGTYHNRTDFDAVQKAVKNISYTAYAGEQMHYKQELNLKFLALFLGIAVFLESVLLIILEVTR